MATSVDESVLADLACERVGRNDAAAAAADEGARASAMDRLVMSQHDLQCLAAWQNVARCCALCSTLFHEIANLGVWTCAQHAGPFELDMWTCCWKRGMRARGCVRSHHKATPGPYDARTQWLKISHSMLKHVAKRMHARTLYECVARDGITVGSSVRVLRYDTAGETFVLTHRRPPTRLEIAELDASAVDDGNAP